MADRSSRAGRPRDATRARLAMLDAAEAIFAQQGFAGARFEAVAQSAGYNSSLLTRYFGNKLGLYAEVLKRADQEMNTLLARVFTPVLEDGTLTSDAHRFQDFLRTMFGAVFDYMVDHPRLMRLLNWEQAEGWQTFRRIAAQFEPDDLAKFEALFSQARRTGLLRADLDTVIMVVLIEHICWSVPAVLPLYQSLLAGRNLSSAAALAHVREQILDFLVAGIMGDPTAKVL